MGFKIPDTNKDDSALTRAQALQHCRQIAQFVNQARAVNALKLAAKLPADMDQSQLISMADSFARENIFRLWFDSPSEPEPRTLSRLTTVRFINGCQRTNTPFIAHICEIPQRANIPKFPGTESEAGLLVMVYSLILQLLHHGPPDDKIGLNESDLKKLGNWSDDLAYWSTAKGILNELLRRTKVRYCIISGLNFVERDARAMCKGFLDSVTKYTNSHNQLRLLLTTSGSSYLLHSYVDREGYMTLKRTLAEVENEVDLSGIWETEQARGGF